MTRTRKVTLSVKEFSHLVSESLDFACTIPCPQSLVDNTAVFSDSPQKTHPRASSFQRIFSRPSPTPGYLEDPSQGPPEDVPDSPRKMSIGWPFSRSPRKNRHAKDEDNNNATEETDEAEADHRSAGGPPSPCSVSSLAAASTSSLGSLVPAHERLFRVADEEQPSGGGQHRHAFIVSCSSPVTIVPPLSEPLTAASSRLVPLDSIFDNGSVASVAASSAAEPASGTSSQGSMNRASFQGTEASHSEAATAERESVDEDFTPRASTFGSRTAFTPGKKRGDHREFPSLAVPSRNVEILALRPAVGVTPHAPSGSESSVSVCSTSSPPSPVARDSSPTLPTMKLPEPGTSSRHVPPTLPGARVPAMSLGIASSSSLESAPPLGFPPRQRKRAMSRSLTPPPRSRPPPTGPLPAVPSSVPPVPPLPPLLNKISMNTNPNSAVSPPPPRSTVSGTPIAALPPSPPGGLRLPSRLSWVNSVRAVLPSPPASPTKSLNSKTPRPVSPSKAEMKKRPNELKRPTSIGVIEAADDVQVRRTKSILLLGSRSKSNASLGTKRVQIHADVNVTAADPSPTTAKPRRKSSAATVGHPVFSSISSGAAATSMQGPELLVLRERRHSSPVLSSLGSKSPAPSADWTLSLPFCTDVPGHQILVSPAVSPKLGPEDDVEEVEGGEDWTLCMPLKTTRVGTPTVESAEGPESECTLADVAETRPAAAQLPTPSPSPTWPTPASAVRALDPEEEEEEESRAEEERPGSPASLGPHVGGLDLAGGRGKRASGWHVYGWFDAVCVPEDNEDEGEGAAQTPMTPASVSDSKFVKSHVSVFRKVHDSNGRHPSQDSMSTVSTSGATYYSARSSLLAN